MKISVITPTLNQGHFIERTIQSVLSQDWEPLEYVIFDGGSTDGTLDILKQYSDRVRWFSEPDQGQADAINKGITATSGEVIGWINSDDIYYPGTIRTIAEYFSAHPDMDVVYGMADHIDVTDYPSEPYPTEPWNLARLQETCFICQPAAFFRRSVVDRHGLLDVGLQYCMDYEYWLRLSTAGVHFGYLERKLAGSRMYANNKTLSARVQVHAEINDMFRRRFGRVPDRWLYNYANALIDERIKKSGQATRPVFGRRLEPIFAALRWNRRVSSDMLRAIIGL